MRSSPGPAPPDDRDRRRVIRPPDEPERSSVHVVLGDPQRAFVEALALSLDGEPDVHVVAAVSDPEEVQRAVRSQRVDVAVLATDLGGGDFVAAGGELLVTRPEVFLVAVSGNDHIADLTRAVRAGFRAWVSKAAGVPTLLEVMRAVRRGETRIPPLLLTGLIERLLHEDEERRAASEPIASLTSRERDVLRALTYGRGRRETADQLGMSMNTLRTHVRNILRKLEVHSTLAAVAIARRAGDI